MTKTSFENDVCNISIEVKEEELRWTDLLQYFIWQLKALGYYSDDFEKIEEEYGR